MKKYYILFGCIFFIGIVLAITLSLTSKHDIPEEPYVVQTESLINGVIVDTQKIRIEYSDDSYSYEYIITVETEDYYYYFSKENIRDCFFFYCKTYSVGSAYDFYESDCSEENGFLYKEPIVSTDN